jgi:hypothetical protein
LGLSTVYGFARRARGLASLHSRPAAGTEVRLCLPTAGGAGESQVEATLPVGAGQRILVVEGDGIVRDYLVGALEMLGYRADAVPDPAAAARPKAPADGQPWRAAQQRRYPGAAAAVQAFRTLRAGDGARARAPQAPPPP